MRTRVGNDDLILHARKNGHRRLSTAQLGRLFWKRIRDHANGRKTVRDQPCVWGPTGANVGPLALPKTATQFELDVDALPALYRYIDSLPP